MNSVKPIKTLLIAQTVVVAAYTLWVFSKEGTGLFHVFLTNMQSVNWSGQFNLDFSCYLLLSGLWISWRSKFTASSIVVAITATIIGIIALAPYLLYLLAKENGNLAKVLIGDRTV